MSKVKISSISEANGKNNEDSFAAITQGDRAVLCIADGIGGLDAGEIASRYLTMYIEEWAKTIDLESMGRATTMREIESLILSLHDDLLAIGEEKSYHLGSTFIIAIVGLTKVIIGAVGDSRLYIRRNKTVHQVTIDQTVAEYERETGEKLNTVPESRKEHTLCEWLGYGKSVPVYKLYECDIEESTDILLCTDGLSNKLKEDEIFTQLKKRQGGDKALATLLEKVQSRGETDNITAVLYRRRPDRSAQKKNAQKTQTDTGTGELRR